MISAGVMMANVIWNMKNAVSGTVPERLAVPTPERNALPRPPIQALLAPPSPKASAYPATSQTTETMAATAKQCISTDSTLREWTSPP
jgi:hypothetical protein